MSHPRLSFFFSVLCKPIVELRSDTDPISTAKIIYSWVPVPNKNNMYRVSCSDLYKFCWTSETTFPSLSFCNLKEQQVAIHFIRNEYIFIYISKRGFVSTSTKDNTLSPWTVIILRFRNRSVSDYICLSFSPSDAVSLS